ncbi:hypothetical protein LCGC14_2113050 [marine sediment metagenome]|uniref:dihydrofolate reductase n=1 Tax=marine sediment metagenome TaxID=412755 RepID=A0A0F9E6G7_9ZZZZ
MQRPPTKDTGPKYDGHDVPRELNIIVCVDNRLGFVKNGRIPWNFKKDFKHFQKTTKEHYCIMGRGTFEDMMRMVEKRKDRSLRYMESPLPGRTPIVLSRNPNYTANGMQVFSDLRQATDSLDDKEKKIFILGGSKLWIEALPDTTTIYMTMIDRSYDCDQFFPGCGIHPDYLAKNFDIVDGKKVKTSRRKDARELTFLEMKRCLKQS